MKMNFSRGAGGSLSHLWKFRGGWGGGGEIISSLQKWKIHGGPKWNSLRGGGLNIFWNHNNKNNDTTDSDGRISLTPI